MELTEDVQDRKDLMVCLMTRICYDCYGEIITDTTGISHVLYLG
jgi:hypothetical protein